MTSERVRVIDGRSVPHVWLNFVDDLPLDAYELRLYFHIVRRGSKSGICNESVDDMAKYCRMSTGVVKRSIRKLIKLGLIRRESHAGRPSDYVIQDISDWNAQEINALSGGESEVTDDYLRVHREWFELTPEQASGVLSAAQEVKHERL